MAKTAPPKLHFHDGPVATGSAHGGEWRWAHSAGATEYEIETCKGFDSDDRPTHRKIVVVPDSARRMPWGDEARLCRVRVSAPNPGPWSGWTHATPAK